MSGDLSQRGNGASQLTDQRQSGSEDEFAALLEAELYDSAQQAAEGGPNMG